MFTESPCLELYCGCIAYQLHEPGLNVLCAHCSLTRIELINIIGAFQLMFGIVCVVKLFVNNKIYFLILLVCLFSHWVY